MGRDARYRCRHEAQAGDAAPLPMGVPSVYYSVVCVDLNACPVHPCSLLLGILKRPEERSRREDDRGERAPDAGLRAAT